MLATFHYNTRLHIPENSNGQLRRTSVTTHRAPIYRARGLTLWPTRTKTVAIINKNYTQEEINTGFGACLLATIWFAIFYVPLLGHNVTKDTEL
jgi:hypothetical protein